MDWVITVELKATMPSSCSPEHFRRYIKDILEPLIAADVLVHYHLLREPRQVDW